MAASNSKAGGRASGTARRTGGGRKHAASLLLRASAATKAKPVAIPVRPGTFKALSSQPGSMAALIETYGAALEKSRLSGRPVRFVVDVGPGGEPKITPVEGSRPAGQGADAAGQDDLEEALAAARERGRLRVAEILSAPDMLSADEFAELIGTSRVTVHAKRQNRQVLGLEGAKRGYRFPEWQVGEDGKPFPALPELFDHLGGSPWAVYRFLVQRHPELDGQTGREALRRGRGAAVIEAAESVARDFA